MDCGALREVRLLEHAMKTIERVVENRIRGLVAIDDMQFGFVSGKGRTHAFLFCEGYERNSVEKRKSCACVL